MKKIYLIHMWDGNSEELWYPWLKEELEKRNVEVIAFDMPNSEHPKIEEWVKHMGENVKDVDEETYFIGHSVGCQAILRFLEKLHKNKKIGGCIFVAGWFNLINLEPEEMEIAHPWLNSKIDFLRILEHCTNFLAIFSDNDPYVSQSNAEIFKKELSAKIVTEKNKGHFEEKIQPGILEKTLNFLKVK
ncbi:MAG: alpha/beta hydrolase [archaeon]